MTNNADKRDELLKKFQEYQKMVAGWLRKVRLAEPDDDYEKSDEYKAALDFYRSFKHEDGVDYSGVVAYACELYERYDKTDKTLDDKADSIIKYLGGGSALITFGALATLKTDTFISCILGLFALISLVPFLVCALFAVRYAIQVRRPRSAATLPSVEFAVRIAHYYKTTEEIYLNLWLIYYPICEAALYRNMQKAKLVESAHKLYVWAMGLLLVPVFFISIWLLAAIVNFDNWAPKEKQGQPIKTGQKL